MSRFRDVVPPVRLCERDKDHRSMNDLIRQATRIRADGTPFKEALQLWQAHRETIIAAMVKDDVRTSACNVVELLSVADDDRMARLLWQDRGLRDQLRRCMKASPCKEAANTLFAKPWQKRAAQALTNLAVCSANRKEMLKDEGIFQAMVVSANALRSATERIVSLNGLSHIASLPGNAAQMWADGSLRDNLFAAITHRGPVSAEAVREAGFEVMGYLAMNKKVCGLIAEDERFKPFWEWVIKEQDDDEDSSQLQGLRVYAKTVLQKVGEKGAETKTRKRAVHVDAIATNNHDSTEATTPAPKVSKKAQSRDGSSSSSGALSEFQQALDIIKTHFPEAGQHSAKAALEHTEVQVYGAVQVGQLVRRAVKLANELGS